MAFEQIPTVSLLDWHGPEADRAAFADRLQQICHEIGFFQVIDHGVDRAFMAEYFASLRAFFALPDDVKATIEKQKSPWFRGWERIGAELTDNKVDHREQIDIWTELSPRPREVMPPYLRLDGPNQWLDDAVLPGFRSLVERFQAQMSDIANSLLAAMSVGLGLPPGYLQERFGERPSSITKLIHYPETPPDAAGVNAHNDAGILTLLWQHGVSGLQAQNQDEEWIDIPPVDHAIVVNLGEILQSMTGNYFVATTHRVIAHQERYSTAYFHGPDMRMALEPLPLEQRFVDAVAASPHHRDAGFMARRDELLDGKGGIRSAQAGTYGEQIWNYLFRSYPELIAAHHPDLVTG